MAFSFVGLQVNRLGGHRLWFLLVRCGLGALVAVFLFSRLPIFNNAVLLQGPGALIPRFQNAGNQMTSGA